MNDVQEQFSKGQAAAFLWLGSNPWTTEEQFEILGREWSVLASRDCDVQERCFQGWMSVWKGESEQERRKQYNQEIDERTRILMENRDKPWLPLVDGE